MILTEFDQEQYDRNRRREGYERGVAIGEKRGVAIGEKRGIAIGEKRGVAIGEKRGITIGEKRGVSMGVQKARLETARNMFANKLPLELISSCTGLSIDELAKLQVQ